MIKRRKKAIIILASVAAVLAAVFFIFIMPLLSTEEGGATMDLLPGEVYDTSGSIMMFERIEQANLKSIEVHNSYGDWSVYRSEKDDNFYIKDHESIPYNMNMFASLVVSAGYTTTLDRVTTDCEDFSEFGLDEASSPAWYKIVSLDGAEHTVYIGDQIPTLGGFYARYEGRDAVYIMVQDVKNTLLAPVNAIAHTLLSYPVSSSSSHTARDFYIMKDGKISIWIDYDATASTTTTTDGGFLMKYPSGFVPNSYNYGEILTLFTEFSGEGVVELGPELSAIISGDDAQAKEYLSEAEEYGKREDIEVGSEEYQYLLIDQTKALMRAMFGKETLDKYGLFDPPRVMHYTYDGVESIVFFSAVQDDGYRYAYSALWNIIVAVDPETVEFLEWDLLQFVSDSLFGIAIDDVSELYFESEQITETFILEGNANDLVVYPKSTGKAFDEDQIYNFKSFYRSLLLISLEDYTDAKTTDDLILTFTVRQRDGTEHRFDFYRYSTRRCYYTINGIGEFYVLSDSVEKAIADCLKVMNSQDVDSWAKD